MSTEVQKPLQLAGELSNFSGKARFGFVVRVLEGVGRFAGGDGGAGGLGVGNLSCCSVFTSSSDSDVSCLSC